MADPAVALETPRPGEVIVEAARVIDRKRIFVNPPILHIGSGAPELPEIRFINHTRKKILVWLPNGHHYLNKDAAELEKPIPIDAGKEYPLPLKAGPEKGHYAYHVYCEEIENGAEGHSEPHVGCP
jgi:hypothetical protein